MSIPELMRLLQFGDSALPVGSFSFSHGLESAVQVGLVRDAESLGEFVSTVTSEAAGVDGVALLAAHRAALRGDLEAVSKADHALLHRKASEELRTMSTRMGRKLAETAERVAEAATCAWWLERIRAGEAPGTHPVGQGLLFADLGLSEEAAFSVHQYGVASAMLGAALRLMRVDHRDTQRLLFQTNARAAEDYGRVAGLDLEDMAAWTPSLDVLAALHVGAHVRLFMN